MSGIIFYTELDKIIGCTRPNAINGEPFCDSCKGSHGICSFQGQCKQDVQLRISNERQLKATFIKLYLEKFIRF